LDLLGIRFEVEGGGGGKQLLKVKKARSIVGE
jgi:hypothetical protein